MRSTFAAVYGEALAGSLARVDAAAGMLALGGAVTTPPSGAVASPDAQHLFLGGRALRRCAVHRLADAMFAAAAEADGTHSAAADARPSRLPGRGRGPARHAAFVLHLCVPPGFADVTCEPDKAVAAFQDDDAVLSLVRVALLAAWEAAGVRPGMLRAAMRAADAAGAVPRAAAEQRPAQHQLAPPPSVGLGIVRGGHVAAPPPPLPLWVHAAKRPREAAAGDDDDVPCEAGCLCARGVPFSINAWPRRKLATIETPEMDAVATVATTWRNPAWPSRAAAAAGDIATAASLGLAPSSLSARALAPAPLLIGQAASTFLLSCTADGVLAAVDPHAAHERVRLEMLRAAAWGPGGSERAPRGVPAAPLAARDAAPLPLTPREAAALRTHAPLLAAWGWSIEPARNAPGGGACAVVVTSTPVIDGVQLRPPDLAEHLRALVDTCGGGAAGGPPAAHRALASRACRGAVTLGTSLSNEDGAALLDALATTAAPLACAHGRPTAAPLADVAALIARLAAAECEATTMRHRISGARAAALLVAAQRL